MGLGKMKEMMWFFQVRRLMDDMAFRTRAENSAGREAEFEAGLKVSAAMRCSWALPCS